MWSGGMSSASISCASRSAGAGDVRRTLRAVGMSDAGACTVDRGRACAEPGRAASRGSWGERKAWLVCLQQVRRRAARPFIEDVTETLHD